MAKRAFLLGGTGQTGTALAPRLLERGWDVVLASRGQREVPKHIEHVALDRENTDALRSALGTGVDVLVDFVAFEPEHAEQLLTLRDLTGSLIVLSSAAVYADAAGRTLDQAKSLDAFPRLPNPVSESHATVAPGPESYSTKKVAIEQALLSADGVRATIVRPCAIHGPGSSLSREWYFVKRALDGRRVICLTDRGRGRFHTTSIENLAELMWLAAEHPGRRVLNCGDPEPPTVLEIARAISAALDYEWNEVLLPEPAYEGVGVTPWSTPVPFVVEMTDATFEVGYRPVVTYEHAVRVTVEWLVATMRNRSWEEALPRSAEYMKDDFDYAAEDEYVASLTAG